ncbi:diguanylate cyclase [Phaeobacter inhibens]|uniref:PAS domain-containing protein n=1 Tax=Phaeobacter inhibens TaxID=221822 RepID=UPI0009719CD8|nr:PAS domain-containing protein [Phaeobacter inhibens]APX14752.1 diguanylate cyclase [Phaeobacter inhibens]
MFFGGRKDNNQTEGQTKVVAMDRFRAAGSLSPMRQAEAYWTALRRGDDIPSRSQIDPRGLENILPQTFILERIAPGIARFRLAGQRVNEMAGMEVRGMPITAFFTPAARKQVSAALETMFDTPAIIELTLQTENNRLRGAREARMLLLPLRSDLGDVSRALGVFISEGNPTGTSQRFSVTETQIRQVSPTGDAPFKAKPRAADQAAPVKPAAPVPAAKDVNKPNAGFAETQARFEREPTVMTEARALIERSRQMSNETPAAPAVEQAEEKSKKRGSHLRLIVSKD